MTPLNAEYQDFRLFIRDTIAQRAERNARYSFRAFARDIGVPAPRLSDIMSKRRRMSPHMALKVALKLKMDALSADYFSSLVQSTDGRTAQLRAEAANRLQLYRRDLVPASDVEKISTGDWHWFHIVLLELVKCRSAQAPADLDWLATRLPLGRDVIAQALTKLVQAGWIGGDGKVYKPLATELTSTIDIPSKTIQTLNREMIERSVEAMQSHPVEERDFSCYTAAVDVKQVPKAKQLINRFRAEMARLVATDKPDAVYTMSIQFYRQDVPAAGTRT